jgi:hypothetical protein
MDAASFCCAAASGQKIASQKINKKEFGQFASLE